MTNKKSTKKALLASALALFVCVSMLIGTTFAWFTDNASATGNKIQSGKLDVTLEMKDANGEWVNAEGKTLAWITEDDVENVLWEPGCTYKLPELKIENKGNLALKYEVVITGITGDAELLEVVTFTGMPVAEARLKPSEFNTFTIEGHMDEAAGNEYQEMTIKDISITINATQETVENDSYSDQYDKDAAYPVTGVANVESNAPATTISADNISVTVPENSPEGVYSVSVNNKNETTDENGLITFSANINLLKDGVKIESNGTTVYLVKIDIGTDKVISKVLHNGNEIADYNYSAETGIIEFETDSFSPFAVIYEENKVVKVESADDFKASLENTTEPTVIDATGVTLTPTGSLSDTITIPAGVTVKGAKFTASSQAYLVVDGIGEDVVFDGCIFEGPGFGMFVIAGQLQDGANMAFESCTFKGQIAPNFVQNSAGVSTFNNCTFTVGSDNIGLVNCMGGTHTFNSCKFDYTGGSTFGSNQYVKWNAVNSYSENYSTNVILNGCTRINCGTQRFGGNSTLTIK